jgi:hypothetical protein
MEVLSREYGWTPQQIKELPSQEIESYLEIIRIRHKLEQAEYKKKR